MIFINNLLKTQNCNFNIIYCNMNQGKGKGKSNCFIVNEKVKKKTFQIKI